MPEELAGRGREERKFVALAPHTVVELSVSGTSAKAYTGLGTRMRITALRDAAPLQVESQSPSRLRTQEREILLDGLAGLMERLNLPS